MHCSTHTLRFHRWQNWQRAWQSHASARREEQRKSLSEVTERRRATHAHEDRPEKAKVAMASVHSCHTASYIVHLSDIARCGRFTLASYAFFLAREATGAQEYALSKPRRRFAQPLRPDLSLTTQSNMSLRPYRRFFPSVAAQWRRCRHCLLSSGTQPATLPKSHSQVCT